MYHHIRGELVDLTPTRAVVEASGVGFELTIPVSTYRQISGSRDVTLLAHHWVREDGQRLFGFATDGERQIFRAVVAVTGIGPAVALAILSSFSVDDFCMALERGDVEALQQIKGVGRKTAERLAVELRDRAPRLFASARGKTGGGGPSGAAPAPLQTGAMAEASLALVELGYSRKDAEKRVAAAVESLGAAAPSSSAPSFSVEQIIAGALRPARATPSR